MTDIWLVRHGEAAASWGEHPDPGLSELGQEQARRAAAELLTLIPRDVQLVSSPKARAQETAMPLAAELGLEVTVVNAFREIAAPVPLNERQHWLKGFMRSEWATQPEDLWAWRRGVIDGLMALNRPTVVFTHFLVINAVLAHVSGKDSTLQLWPDNASHHQFRLKGSDLEIIALGREMTTRVN